MDFPGVAPMLSYEDVGSAADWLCAAFGFEDLSRFEGGGRVTHVNPVAGATILGQLVVNSAVGQRQYRAEDVEGQRWMFAEPL